MSAQPDQPVEITAPGVYDIDNLTYHADPVPGGSLSNSGCSLLLEPNCPALYRWRQDHPEPPTDSFDVGNAVHDMILGGGPEIVRLDYPNLLSGAAKNARDEARARGAVPVLAHIHDEVKAMADAVLTHPIAGTLLEAGTGQAEASLFWTDERTGVIRRSRLDWLPAFNDGPRLIIPDLKTTKSAQRDDFAKSAMSYGYHRQGPFYCDGVRTLGLHPHPVMVFVAVEKTPPYLVNVIQLDVAADRIGAAQIRRAIDIYADCDRTGVWPSYSDAIQLASLPAWYERQHEEDLTL